MGCGLGLTLSKNLAQALDGDITVTSEVDVGSTFRLVFKDLVKTQESRSIESLPSSIYSHQRRMEERLQFQQEECQEDLHSEDVCIDINIDHNLDSINLYTTDMQKPNPSFKNSTTVCNCKSILLADDDPLSLMALEGMISLMGHTVDKAFNGKAALEKIKARSQNPTCHCK